MERQFNGKWPLPGHPGHRSSGQPIFFAKTVNDMSSGRLEIKSFPAGKLIGALEVFDAVKMGTIDVGHSSPSYHIGKIPAGALFGYIPFGMEAIPYLIWMYDGEGLTLYNEMYAKYGFGFAAPCGILPAKDLAWSNKPIKSMEDFKGLKFRTSGYWGEILTEAGASVMMLPAGEIYEALQRNVLDAAEFSIPSMDKTLSFHEATKYLLVPGIHQPSTTLDCIINKKSWDKLPDDLKNIVKNAAEVTTMRMLTNSINKDISAIEFFKEKGINVIYLEPGIQKALHAKSVALMGKKAAADPFFAKVWKSQLNFRKGYNSYKKMMTPQYE
ncbi:MAG: ABC transporter substrate-binding protein [Deltaproteobacteria bacterium CG23_combo_of_CG06-09_8_20_14_all_51_20]|nr:MAG: ABC transporter substrate-binding protein [Deltaproteobacteria bacterium CG23_combo_of_CG06-09_8_20_14_all_51_20]PIY27213.1 MAG: ABC transporter substrate-binding protein [Deltaproteobacteria bacterium CG_4_10_14_3_um_filter_51_14]PJB34338.1 MAG: ABC transporter substrate-binding protein [Deltaproteobacteria bacterium CG_4_9_14_3_um_filter_51_14]